MAERTTIMIDRELLAEAQRTAARKGVPMGVAGSTSKFIRFLLQDYCARAKSNFICKKKRIES